MASRFFLFIVIFFSLKSFVYADQKTVYATEDAFVSAFAPNTNYGSDPDLLIGYQDLQGSNDYYTYIKFENLDIPSSSTIISATIYLYSKEYQTVNSSFFVDVFNLNENWNENSLTYNNASLSWGPHDGYDNFTQIGWWQIDILPIVENWINNGIPNYGVAVVSDVSPEGQHYGVIASKEFSSGSYKAYIVIDYIPQVTHSVSSASISVTPEDVRLNSSSVNGLGNVYGTGDGPVTYKWWWQTPGGATNSSPITLNTTMTNGLAVIPFELFPVNEAGTYTVWLETISPNFVNSNTVSYDVASTELTPYRISETDGTANTNNPGTTKSEFYRGETVRVTLQAYNSGGSVPVATFLDIRDPNDLVLYQDPGNSYDTPLDQNETDYYSFDWTIPNNAEFGNYDITGSIKNPNDLSMIFDDTENGPNTSGLLEPAWLLNSFSVITNTPPSAPVSELANQPGSLYPNVQYSVTSKYFDPDGRTDLHFCDLRLNHPTGDDITLRWEQNTGNYYPWAGLQGADYLTLDNVNITEITEATEGYEITWTFTLNTNWQSTESGINYGIYAEDDGGLIDGWNFDNSNSSFALYGTTIITHGFQAGGILPYPGDWLEDMAQAIRARAGLGRVMLYNKSTGQFDIQPNSDQSGETILIFDWAIESDDNFSGFSEAAGDALFAALLNGENNGDFSLNHLHFIGHSRGCVVNSEAVERLIALGRAVDYVTYLDAHDWGAAGFADDHDVNYPIVINEPANRIPNRGVISWQGVAWSDSYWQDSNLIPPFLEGRAVFGTDSVYLGKIGHSNVQTWYLGTIDHTSGNSSWYGGSNPTRTEGGYNYSRIGGRTQQREPIWGDQQETLHNFAIDGIVIGDFDRGPMVTRPRFPGWSEHGGDGNGHFDGGHLELDWSSEWRRHNRFHIPQNAEKIWFQYKINNASSGSPPNTDKLQILIGTTPALPLEGDIWLNQTTQNYNYASIDISSYANTVNTLTFQIQEYGIVDSEVWIDNITFQLDPSVPSAPLTPFALQPLDEDTITNLTPTLEWSPFQDGGDGDTQSGYQIRVRDDDNGDLIVYNTGFIPDNTNSTHSYSPGAYTGIDPETGDTRVSDPLVWGNHYHWHVRYRDSGSDWSEWSADDPNPHQDFYTNSRPVVTAVSPTSGEYKDNISLSATSNDPDAGDIVISERYEYSLNGLTNWIPIPGDDTTPEDAYSWPSGLDESTVWIRAKATDGIEWGAWYTGGGLFLIDNTAPITTDDVPAAWQTSDFAITLTPDDGSGSGFDGSGATYFSTDGNTPSIEGTSIPITQSGEYTIRYYSIDDVGNQETTITAQNIARLDKYAPNYPNWTQNPSDLISTYSGVFQVTVDIEDLHSGLGSNIPKLDYRIGSGSYDGYEVMTYVSGNTWSFNIPEPVNGWGTYANMMLFFKVQAQDLAGNISESPEQNELIDDATPNTAPILSWTGESGFTNDGVNPDTGYALNTFQFRVTYSDENGDPPMSGYPKLHLNKNGTAVGAPMTMYESNTEPFQTGRIYSIDISNLAYGEDYSYYFAAQDENGTTATGDGIVEQTGPIVNTSAISSVSPIQNALNIGPNSNIEIIFEQPLDPASLTNNSIKVMGSHSGPHTSSSIVYDDVNYRIIFDPDADYKYGETVTTSITTDIKFSNGSPISTAFTWEFIIETLPDSGSFVNAGFISGAPLSLKASDYNIDNRVDIVGADYGLNGVYHYINNGTAGFFSNFIANIGTNSWDVTSADFDSDGDVDIAVANEMSNDATILKNDGGGGFTITATIPVGNYPRGITHADFDGDGDVDLVVGCNSIGTFILENDGNGNFTQTLSLSGVNRNGIIAADFNNDGFPDILTSGGTLLLNDKTGNFTVSPGFSYGSTAAAGDFNSDGMLDIALGEVITNNVQIYRNDSNGTFTETQTLAMDGFIWSICAGDYDGDGDLDLFIADEAIPTITLLINDGSGLFSQGQFDTYSGQPKAIEAADFDSDGDLDLAVSGLEGNNVSFFGNSTHGQFIPSTSQQDSLALVALYNSTDGINWTNNTNWLTTEPLENWYGVTLTDGRVSSLDLHQNNLTGTIPPEIGDLKKIRQLHLYSNNLSGSIPSEIGYLIELIQLYLFSNNLTGTIPTEIGNLTKLVYLYLDRNSLTGSLPNEIGNLTDLQGLYLHLNNLTGSIPIEIGNLTKLVRLYFYGNSFTGNIPATIGDLTSLQWLYLSNNNLSGSIPVEIGQLSNLQYLHLNANILTGSIPSEISNLTNLVDFRLGNNNLTGSIPIEIGMLSNLGYLSLSYNKFSGVVPNETTNLTNLQYLYFNLNNLEELPDYSAFTSLSNLNIANNRFTFEDIEPNIAISNFLYSPQDSVGTNSDTTLQNGYSFTVSVNVGGATNLYQWFKDGTVIPGANGSQYTIVSVSPDDAGVYTCNITNTIATALTLHRRPITVNVNNPLPILASIVPVNKPEGNPGFTLTVNGTNFVSSSVVRFNSNDRSTTFVGDSQLTASIPAVDLTTPGTYPVTVFNPVPGGGLSDSLFFTVLAANYPPVAVDDSVATTEDSIISIQVLANDSDPENHPLSIIAVTQPDSGAAAINPGDTTVTYTPNLNYYGQIFFDYVVSDSLGGTDTAQVLVSVTPVNDPPVISGLPDSLEFVSDSTLTLNIWDYVSDIETPDDSLTYYFSATNDSLLHTYNSVAGVLTLSAEPQFGGEAVLSITVKDEVLDSAQAVIIVRVIPALVTFDKIVLAGWNLIALSLDVENMYYLSVFPNAIPGTLFGFTSSYFPTDTLELCTGYWLKFPAAEVIPISGVPVNSCMITLNQGWNLIGGPSCDITLADVSDPDSLIVQGTVYGFNGTYFPADSIKQGYGYWTKAFSAGTITLNCGGTLAKLFAGSRQQLLDESRFASLEIGDAAGFAQTLYITEQLENPALLESYSLPPVPPAGSFDIRFSTGHRLAEGKEALIEIQSTHYPLTVRLNNPTGAFNERYLIKEMTGNTTLAEHIVLEDEPLVISNPLVNKLKLAYGEDAIPKTFSVSQNYPNPFNPTTEIRFALPQKGKVTVELYNTLGQKVRTLLSKTMETGYHSITWDATNDTGQKVSSGIYFYRVVAGEHMAVRKMILLK